MPHDGIFSQTENNPLSFFGAPSDFSPASVSASHQSDAIAPRCKIRKQTESAPHIHKHPSTFGNCFLNELPDLLLPVLFPTTETMMCRSIFHPAKTDSIRSHSKVLLRYTQKQTILQERTDSAPVCPCTALMFPYLICLLFCVHTLFCLWCCLYLSLMLSETPRFYRNF